MRHGGKSFSDPGKPAGPSGPVEPDKMTPA
jgi:hypothetical protein